MEATVLLPRDQVLLSPSFRVVGTDQVGPLNFWVTLEITDKCYTLLFTCVVTCAVHLELTKSKTVQHLLQALKRFISGVAFLQVPTGTILVPGRR